MSLQGHERQAACDTNDAKIKADPAVVLELFQIGIGIYVGKNGNQWREQSLKARGYRFQREVAAKTGEGAIRAIAEVEALAGGV